MVDRPPPSRYSVVERGGRLVVIDTQTGQTPPTAAERMDNHDRALGVEPIRPARTSTAPDLSAAARAESGLSARPAPVQQTPKPAPAKPAADPGKARKAAKAAERQSRPWTQGSHDRPAPKTDAAPARIPQRPAPPARGRKTIVTGKWWDSKGPRTIELGPKGQQTLSGGFVTLFFVVLIAAMVVMFIEPIILFVAAFLLFRFGGSVLGPIGAGIVDKALAERN
ncbi:hypothetical protein [Sphingopyxis sp. Root1497]|uniref:hypothetical protein n=1 Tax=Sphingopyxis sp. Root1497 TaxID=1736474 RepID=UPI0006FDD8DA|nr:hypothetical protein [Sphingopyxis sp. Root1497]